MATINVYDGSYETVVMKHDKELLINKAIKIGIHSFLQMRNRPWIFNFGLIFFNLKENEFRIASSQQFSI
jgi:hypothetical protein